MSRGLREMKAEPTRMRSRISPTRSRSIRIWPRRTTSAPSPVCTAGDTPGAIADIQATLQHEPRSFAAFQTLAAIAEARKDWKGAYEAWQKVMEIDPKTPGGEERLKDLRRHALGEEA